VTIQEIHTFDRSRQEAKTWLEPSRVAQNKTICPLRPDSIRDELWNSRVEARWSIKVVYQGHMSHTFWATKAEEEPTRAARTAKDFMVMGLESSHLSSYNAIVDRSVVVLAFCARYPGDDVGRRCERLPQHEAQIFCRLVEPHGSREYLNSLYCCKAAEFQNS
jgi:hypothetical protein